MKKVKVFDAIMGSGKTYKAIERMKNIKNNFIYVTPFLEEVKRVTEQVENAYEPEFIFSKNYLGETIVTNKRDNLLGMANNEKNIVTTHSLFSRLHKTDYKYFENYELILDEVLNPIEIIGMKKDDIKIAFEQGLLTLNEETREVIFTGEDYNGRFYADLKKYCDTANVTFINNRLLVWSFPIEIFKSFKSVSVLTYLFEGSLLCGYFKYSGVKYSLIKESTNDDAQIKNRVKQLLNIYEGPSNKIGERNNAFCINWLKGKNPAQLKKIKNTVANLIYRNFNSSSQNTGFTTFKEFASKLKGKGYSRGFIPVNERATNKYSNIESMIYLANRFLNPNEVDFFRLGGVTIEEDKWALSELLQWIWRGSIRRNKPMNLFIPSKRMRMLLYAWLENEH